jgi:hypothetical protein
MQATDHHKQEQQGAGIALQMLNGMIKASTQAERSRLLRVALTSTHHIGEPALAGFSVVILNLLEKGLQL